MISACAWSRLSSSNFHIKVHNFCLSWNVAFEKTSQTWFLKTRKGRVSAVPRYVVSVFRPPRCEIYSTLGLWISLSLCFQQPNLVVLLFPKLKCSLLSGAIFLLRHLCTASSAPELQAETEVARARCQKLRSLFPAHWHPRCKLCSVSVEVLQVLSPSPTGLWGCTGWHT